MANILQFIEKNSPCTAFNIWVIAVTHRTKLRHKEVITTMIRWSVFFNVCEFYKLKPEKLADQTDQSVTRWLYWVTVKHSTLGVRHLGISTRWPLLLPLVLYLNTYGVPLLGWTIQCARSWELVLRKTKEYLRASKWRDQAIVVLAWGSRRSSLFEMRCGQCEEALRDRSITPARYFAARPHCILDRESVG